MSILKVENLSKSFDGLRALKDITLSIKQGAIASIIGPNGAGKTTLFNCLTGFSKPSSGAVFYKGREITGMSPHKIAGIGIARTFQNIRLFGALSVIENMLIGCHISKGYGFFSALMRGRRFSSLEKSNFHRSMGILDMLELSKYAKHLASSLPYGLQRRLEIARAMAMNPKLLLLDEPSAGMNPSETLELMRQLIRLREEGVTLLIIEHDMTLVMGLSEQITVLNYGTKIAEGTPDQIRNNSEVIEAYLGSANGQF